MWNWADLCWLMTLLMGPLCGFTVAASYKADTSSAIFFAVVCFVVSYGIARVSRKYAYAMLEAKKLSDTAVLVFYILIPPLGLLAATLLHFIFAEVVFGR